MNTLCPTDKDSPKDVHIAAPARKVDQLDEPWFDTSPPPSGQRPSVPVHVGEFLGDPEVDAWLR